VYASGINRLAEKLESEVKEVSVVSPKMHWQTCLRNRVAFQYQFLDPIRLDSMQLLAPMKRLTAVKWSTLEKAEGPIATAKVSKTVAAMCKLD
jgi:hypothetical protein